jgi:thiamine pyrophosphate-dependent acetolactate synthase large subunit-like protein
VTETTGFDLVAHTLLDRSEGRPVFGLLGDANLAPIARFAELGGRFVSARHESGAIGMATGYALATDAVSVATMTRGPGFTNAMTGLITAVRDRVPLVVLAGGSPLSGLQNNQVINEHALTEPVGAVWVAVRERGHLEAALVTAFDRAGALRTPVVVHVPSDLLHSPAVPQSVLEAAPADASRYPMIDAAAVQEAARHLTAAERPIILVGRGVRSADTRAAIGRLAERVGALLVGTLPMKGSFHGDSFDLGFTGGFALPRTRELVDGADLVLAIGASLNRYTMADGTAFPDAALIHIDVDGGVLGRVRETAVSLHGPAETIVPALLDAVGERSTPGYRTEEVARQIADTRDGLDLAAVHGPDTVDPRWALSEIDRAMAPERRVVVDIGHFSTFPCQVLPIETVGQLIPAFGFAAVGMGLSTAIGASLADDAGVHLVIGDGGLLMSLGELETARRSAGRLLITVLDDAAYGAEVHHLRRRGLDDGVARFPPTDFAAVAGALRIPAIRLQRPDDLPAVVAMVEREPVVLVDVAVNPAVVSDRFRHAAEHGAA